VICKDFVDNHCQIAHVVGSEKDPTEASDKKAKANAEQF